MFFYTAKIVTLVLIEVFSLLPFLETISLPDNCLVNIVDELNPYGWASPVLNSAAAPCSREHASKMHKRAFRYSCVFFLLFLSMLSVIFFSHVLCSS